MQLTFECELGRLFFEAHNNNLSVSDQLQIADYLCETLQKLNLLAYPTRAPIKEKISAQDESSP